MIVIILAAGVGKRLAPYSTERPKCLMEVGNHTLLERHLVLAQRFGAERAVIVDGNLHEMIHDTVEHLQVGMPVDFVHNENFRKGSITSLSLGLERADDDIIFMDADVLYHPDIYKRLFTTSHACALLLDASSEETGEEMMIGVKNNRAVVVERKVSHLGPFDLIGETIGFYKIAKDKLPALKQAIAETLSTQGDQVEYEAALNLLFAREAFGIERIDPMPWTEIDFASDLEKARNVVAPKLPPLYT